jgi:hypothetical protein
MNLKRDNMVSKVIGIKDILLQVLFSLAEQLDKFG